MPYRSKMNKFTGSLGSLRPLSRRTKKKVARKTSTRGTSASDRKRISDARRAALARSAATRTSGARRAASARSANLRTVGARRKASQIRARRTSAVRKRRGR